MKLQTLLVSVRMLVISTLVAGCATIPVEQDVSPDYQSPPVSNETNSGGDEAGIGPKILIIPPKSTEDQNESSVVLEGVELSLDATISTVDQLKPLDLTDEANMNIIYNAETDKRNLVLDENQGSVTNLDVIVAQRNFRSNVELNFGDSVSYLVMVRPGDYLGKIALREYQNIDKWKSIYHWNRVLIGNNPNSILPYRELTLYKPQQEISIISYDFIIHSVVAGETLWSIAKNWYGDNLAWVVLHQDNEELMRSRGGRLIEGMELKIRTVLIDRNAENFTTSITQSE